MDRLRDETSIHTGGALISRNQCYFAKVQEDGNFVVYVSGHHVAKNAIWSSESYGKGRYLYSCI